jgi:hypothetical protein
VCECASACDSVQCASACDSVRVCVTVCVCVCACVGESRHGLPSEAVCPAQWDGPGRASRAQRRGGPWWRTAAFPRRHLHPPGTPLRRLWHAPPVRLQMQQLLPLWVQKPPVSCLGVRVLRLAFSPLGDIRCSTPAMSTPSPPPSEMHSSQPAILNRNQVGRPATASVRRGKPSGPAWAVAVPMPPCFTTHRPWR